MLSHSQIWTDRPIEIQLICRLLRQSKAHLHSTAMIGGLTLLSHLFDCFWTILQCEFAVTAIIIDRCIMLFARAATRGASGLRKFSTTRILRSELAYQVFGPENEHAVRDPILFLHGLFGSKQNNRSISKYVYHCKSIQLSNTGYRALARDLKCQIFTLVSLRTPQLPRSHLTGFEQDLRNHGQSFHSEEHNYSVMADDVQKFIEHQKLGQCVLIGHSM